MYVNEFVTPLINEFGLLPVISIWLLLGSFTPIMVQSSIDSGEYISSAFFALICPVMPGLSLWILKFWFEYIPFPPRTILDVEVVDVSSMGIYFILILLFTFLASSELTGDISK